MDKRGHDGIYDAGRMESEKYVPSPEVEEEFERAARYGLSNDEHTKKLEQHHSKSPILSGGDIDAA